MNTLLKKSVAIFATAAILASTSVTAFAVDDPVAPAGNTDNVVWVGGKDIKDDKKTENVDETELYKTESYNWAGYYSGGKLGVAVIAAGEAPTEVEAFTKMFENGKLKSDIAKAGKDLASAKIKEGVITVTAGKKAGAFEVWVYEVKKNADKKNEVVNGVVPGTEITVVPTKVAFTSKVAPTGLTFTTDEVALKDGLVPATANKKLEAVSAGDKLTLNLVDKKVAYDPSVNFVLWDAKNKTALEVGEDGTAKVTGATAKIVTAEGAVPALEIVIDDNATDKTKIEVSVMCKESGKVLKVAPKVAKVVAVDEVTVKFSSNMAVVVGEKELASGDKVAKGTKISASFTDGTTTTTRTLTVNGKETGTAVKKNVTVDYTITGTEKDATVELKFE